MCRFLIILFILTMSRTLTAQQSFDINRFSDPTKYGWEDWFDRINYRLDLAERQKLLQLYENESQRISVNVIKSAMIPGWGHYSTRSYVKGHIFLGTEIVLVGLSTFYYIRAMDYYRKYNEATQVIEIENLYKKAQAEYQYTFVLTGLAAVVWLFNVYDVVRSTEAYNAKVWQKIYSDHYKVPLKLTPNGIEVWF